MIDKSLIESARIIRNRFLKLNEELSNYEGDVKSLAQLFFKVASEFENIEKEIDKNDDILKIRDKVISKLNGLELESEKISTKINSVNSEIEKLKKEELDLYHLIKRRYPSLSDDEIKIEIQKELN